MLFFKYFSLKSGFIMYIVTVQLVKTSFEIKIAIVIGGLFRTQSNIYEEAFLLQ